MGVYDHRRITAATFIDLLRTSVFCAHQPLACTLPVLLMPVLDLRGRCLAHGRVLDLRACVFAVCVARCLAEVPAWGSTHKDKLVQACTKVRTFTLHSPP